MSHIHRKNQLWLTLAIIMQLLSMIPRYKCIFLPMHYKGWASNHRHKFQVVKMLGHHSTKKPPDLTLHDVSNWSIRRHQYEGSWAISWGKIGSRAASHRSSKKQNVLLLEARYLLEHKSIYHIAVLSYFLSITSTFFLIDSISRILNCKDIKFEPRSNMIQHFIREANILCIAMKIYQHFWRATLIR